MKVLKNGNVEFEVEFSFVPEGGQLYRPSNLWMTKNEVKQHYPEMYALTLGSLFRKHGLPNYILTITDDLYRKKIKQLDKKQRKDVIKKRDKIRPKDRVINEEENIYKQLKQMLDEKGGVIEGRSEAEIEKEIQKAIRIKETEGMEEVEIDKQAELKRFNRLYKKVKKKKTDSSSSEAGSQKSSKNSEGKEVLLSESESEEINAENMTQKEWMNMIIRKTKKMKLQADLKQQEDSEFLANENQELDN